MELLLLLLLVLLLLLLPGVEGVTGASLEVEGSATSPSSRPSSAYLENHTHIINKNQAANGNYKNYHNHKIAASTWNNAISSLAAP